jgi:NitT/TauT family transport system permease protein
MGLLAIVIPATLVGWGGSAASVLSNFPTAGLDLTYSFGRMMAAYLASLGFALAYGYYAAVHRPAERVMIPVLDILQSVPILGFFPVAILFFVGLTGPGSFLGPNLASVFLIFTSMAWNMVFGVYESLKTIPPDLQEASHAFGITGLQRFRRVVLPATANRLVYNSILSWTAGWFFLVEAEIFSTNSSTGITLPGIGSYLSLSAASQDAGAFVAGILLLVTLIALLDFGVWRPLSRWAEKFRYDQTPSSDGVPAATERYRYAPLQRAASFVSRGLRSGASRLRAPWTLRTRGRHRTHRDAPGPLASTAIKYVVLGSILVVVWLMLIAIIVSVYQLFSAPILPAVRAQILELPAAMGFSVLRVAAAFLISLAITLPLSIHFARVSSRASRYGLPIVEVIASFPATALFPVIIFELLPYLTGEGAAILMLMTGMMWYLLFNLLSGIRGLPPDLAEASRSFGAPRWLYLRRVLLPAIFPAFVTGAITAFGGGWNTLIVAEYLSVGNRTFQLFGVGQMIDLGAQETGGLPLLAAALFTLVVTVIALNELIWKPMYRKAVEKYRYD